MKCTVAESFERQMGLSACPKLTEGLLLLQPQERVQPVGTAAGWTDWDASLVGPGCLSFLEQAAAALCLIAAEPHCRGPRHCACSSHQFSRELGVIFLSALAGGERKQSLQFKVCSRLTTSYIFISSEDPENVIMLLKPRPSAQTAALVDAVGRRPSHNLKT